MFQLELFSPQLWLVEVFAKNRRLWANSAFSQGTPRLEIEADARPSFRTRPRFRKR